MGIQIYKLKEILLQAQNDRIVLPNFQREFTYSRSQQKELLLSLFCGIPIGTILTLTGSSSSFHYRKIGRKSGVQDDSPIGEKVFLLDGQQRMSTFWNALTDIYSGKPMKAREALYSDTHNYLHSRWFIRLRKDDIYSDDIWGLWNLGGGSELQDELLPDDLSEFLVYNNSVKGPSLNWGEELSYPTKKNNSVQARAYADFLERNWMVPLHLISSPSALNNVISRIGSRRQSELFFLFNSWLNDPSCSYDDLADDEKSLLSDVLEVDSADGFDSLDPPQIQTLLSARQSEWTNRISTFCQRVLETDIGVIQLGQEALSKGHVIFDVINRSGVKLSAFDLFCASKPDIEVRTTVNRLVPDEAGMKDKHTELVSDAYTNQLLNLLKVIHAHRSGVLPNSVLKDDKIFSISGGELSNFLEDTINSLNEAYRLVHRNCGVISVEKMPYELRILPIAFSIYLNVQGHNSTRAIYLYWLLLFGGRYRENQNARCLVDLKMVQSLSSGAKMPEEYSMNGSLWNSILGVQDYNDLDSLIPLNDDVESRSSVRDGILQYILSQSPSDFPPNTNKNISSSTEKLEIHHILPIGSSGPIGKLSRDLRSKPKHYLNSVLNLTYITSESNRAIGGMDFLNYSQSFTEELKRNHCIPNSPAAIRTEEWNREWLRGRFELIKLKIKNQLETLHSTF
jgi:hypothetical protein